MRLPRPLYIGARLLEALGSAASRFVNAAFFGGSTAQTLSARAHIEARTSTLWARRQRFINRLFFFQPEHCRWAWASEVSNARRTLARNGATET